MFALIFLKHFSILFLNKIFFHFPLVSFSFQSFHFLCHPPPTMFLSPSPFIPPSHFYFPSHGTAIDAADTESHSWRVLNECHCATADLCDCIIRVQCVISCGPVAILPRTIRPTKSSRLFVL